MSCSPDPVSGPPRTAPVNGLAIIDRFYRPGSKLHRVLVLHSRIVTRKSLAIARRLAHLNPDLDFIRNAAMLHDIGIFMTRSRSMGCKGEHPYVCHGFLGRKLLDDLGLPEAYGLVCERHTGAGITISNIRKNSLPLPEREMVPATLEEIIICLADKFHSKSPKKRRTPFTTDVVIQKLERISPEHSERFSGWLDELGLDRGMLPFY